MKTADFSSIKTLLDVGCGPGSLVRRLAHTVTAAYGCDADRGMIEQARKLADEEGVRTTGMFIIRARSWTRILAILFSISPWSPVSALRRRAPPNAMRFIKCPGEFAAADIFGQQGIF